MFMNRKIKMRILKEAQDMKDTNHTIREIAAIYQISKSTVHKDLTERIQEVDPYLAQEIRKILDEHLKLRHIHGGESTRIKYLQLK